MRDIRTMLNAVEDLPTVPEVVTVLNRQISDPSSSASDINTTLSRDAALSATILRLVNSPFYGFARRITSVTHAVVILGYSAVRSLALSAFVFESVGRNGASALDVKELWRHALGAAVAGRTAARHLRIRQDEDAFVGGLLHDLGKVVMNQYFTTAAKAVAAEVKASDCLFREAEAKVIDYDHASLGGGLAERWNLPGILVGAIACHHAPASAPEACRTLAGLVHVADILARTLLVGSGGDRQIPELSPEVCEALGLKPESMEPLLRETAVEIEKAADFFTLI